MNKNIRTFVVTMSTLLLTSSILYAYGTITVNSSRITKVETRQMCIDEIKHDIQELRKGQREILKLLIQP